MPPPDLARLKELKRQIDEATEPRQRDAAEAIFRENLHAYLLRDARISSNSSAPDWPWPAVAPAARTEPPAEDPVALLAGTSFTTADTDPGPGAVDPDRPRPLAFGTSGDRAAPREHLFRWLRFGIAMLVGALVVWSLSGAFGPP